MMDGCQDGTWVSDRTPRIFEWSSRNKISGESHRLAASDI